MQKQPFGRLVREITQDFGAENPYASNIRYQGTAVLANQEASEAALIQTMDGANRAALYGKRVTIMPKDIQLVRILAGHKGDNYNMASA